MTLTPNPCRSHRAPTVHHTKSLFDPSHYTLLLYSTCTNDYIYTQVEIHLVETRCCFNCSNLPKARASLTSAKTNANAIHCHPLQQAEIDLWSGIISLRERDPRTAFSYLYEAFEAFNTNTEAIDKVDGMSLKALQSVRAQLISKIMLDDPHACKQIVQSESLFILTLRLS